MTHAIISILIYIYIYTHYVIITVSFTFISFMTKLSLLIIQPCNIPQLRRGGQDRQGYLVTVIISKFQVGTYDN